ncbi:MAG: FtsQ-type POTRA domain-containing protein [Pseudomonadota bacterium]
MKSDTKMECAGFDSVTDLPSGRHDSVNGAGKRRGRLSRKIQSFVHQKAFSRKSWAAMIAAAVVIVGTGYVSVKKPQFVTAMASKTGFSAKSLIVKGNSEVEAQNVEYSLAPQLQGTIFSFDTNLAREELLKNPWLKTANVRKVYPDKIVVEVVEREPFAFWKSSDTVTVIARDGVVLGEASPEHLRLPQVVGTGANLAASEFISGVARFPKIVTRASAFVRIADRRWDIVIDDGTKILLPEDDWQVALAELESLQINRGILDRELMHIDMRLPDRMVLRLDPEAAKQRAEHLESVLKRDWHRT